MGEAKLTPLQKLAREICWAGFTTKDGRAGKTKASYWRRLPDETRAKYEIQARHFAWLLRTIPVDALNDAHNIGH